MENSFNKRKQEILEFNTAMEELNLRKKYAPQVPKEIPDDLIVKCPGCARLILKDNYILDHKVCPYCNHHGRLTSKERIIDVLDLGYEELFTRIKENYLDFPDYENKLEKAKKDTGEDESVMCVLGKINGISVCVGVMDSFFMMGSMGSVCGERITKLIEYATEKNLPLILFTTS